MLVDFREGLILGGGIETVVAVGMSDSQIVLLLDKTVVVLTVGSGASEGDVVLCSPADQLVIDKLPSVVAVQALHGEGQRFAYVFCLFSDPTVGPIG